MPFLNTQFTLSTTAIKTSCCSPKTHRVCIKLQNHFPLGGCKLAGLYSYKTSPFLLPLVIFLLREASPKEGVNIPLSFAKAGKSRPLPTSSCTRSRCWARYWSCQEFLTTWPLSGEPDFAERRQEEAITKWKLEVARPQTVKKIVQIGSQSWIFGMQMTQSILHTVVFTDTLVLLGTAECFFVYFNYQPNRP